jgi:eukaryotic-like serine/threonine-protein kinase
MSTLGNGAPSPPIRALLDSTGNDVRLGPFVLVRPLGHGGFAPVWLAEETYGSTVVRTAAVKMFSLRSARDRLGEGGAAAFREQVVREARALCQVEHPNVVRFYSLPVSDDGAVLGLAMEHVAGVSLDRQLTEGPFDLAAAIEVGVAVAGALAAVHRVGLVHGDVKPANVIDAEGVYKLIDFGIASVHGEGGPGEVASALGEGGDDDGATAPFHAGAGTRGYMDPASVATGAPASAESDLYALGAMLFQLVTGRVPAASRAGDVDDEVLDGRRPAPSLRTAAPGAPLRLVRLVDDLLAPDRASRPRSAERVAFQLERIRRELRGGDALPPEDVGPFRGLGRFEGPDRDVYFGRAGEIAAALSALRDHGLVAIVGPSGSGKSSLARAGVLPAVADGALGDLPMSLHAIVASPGADPRAAIGAALAAFLPGAAELSPDELVTKLATSAQARASGVVLLVDQLEELATVASPGASRSWAVDLLATISERAVPGLRAIVAVRRDLLDPLLAMGRLGPSLVQASVLLEPIAGLTWARVLDLALDAYGYSFEDDALREELMAQIEPVSDAMPLVQFALSELWVKRDTENRRVTRASLREIGGIAGALTRHAEATVAALGRPGPNPDAAVRAVLVSLTTARGTRAVRTDAELAEVAGPRAKAILHALESARLVQRTDAGCTLAHESLIDSWPRLRTWVGDERADREVIEELERDAAAWRDDPELMPLWQRRRLESALRLAGSSPARLSGLALAFVAASRRAARRSRLALVGSGVVVAASLAGAGLAYLSGVREEQRKTEQALRLEQESRALAERRTREVQEAQARIDGLLKDLADSPTKEQVIALQRRIRDTAKTSEPDERRPPSGAAAPSSAGSTQPAPRPPTSADTLKVQEEW